MCLPLPLLLALSLIQVPPPPVEAPPPVPQPAAPAAQPPVPAAPDAQTAPAPPQPLAGVPVLRDPKGSRDIAFNFSNARLYDVIQQVARLAGLNHVIDPAVKDGPVRLFMNGKLQESSLEDVLGLALKLHGVAVVRNGDFLEFVPLGSATGLAATPLYSGTRPPEHTPDSFAVTYIVPLKYLDAEAFAGFAKEFASRDGRILLDRGRNLIIVLDHLQHVRRVLEFAELMDRQPFQQKKVALFRLQNSSPDRVLKELEPILKATNVPVGSGALQLLPLQSLNALLLVSSSSEWIPDIQAWIQRFDETPRTEEGELFVLPLRYAKAETLFGLLSQVLRIGAGAPAAGPGRPAAALASTTMTAPRPFGAPTSPLGSGLGTYPVLGTAAPAPEPATPPAALSPSAPTPAPPPSQGSGPLSPYASLSVDADSNALVVFGTRRDAALVEQALEKLDRMPRQVLIEATILDLSMTGEFEFGLSGFLKSRFDPSEVNLNDLETPAERRDWKVERPAADSAFQFAGVFTSRLGLVNLLLTARDSKKNVNVLSQPRIWALDNRPARLLVQDQIPIPVNTFIPGTGTGTGSSGYSVTNAQYLDTGLNLTVTPHINGSGVIRLEIQQEISSSSGLETLGSGSSAIQAPRISRRSLSTELISPDGATVVLGGLVRQDSALSSSGLPFLNRIPGLRSLFGSTRRVNQKSELVILLTPKVVTDTEGLDRLSAEVRTRLEAATARMAGPLEPLLPASPRTRP